MSATLIWHDVRQSVLICRFEGEFGVDNYAVLEGQLPMEVREQDHRVDVILHLAEGADLPPLRGILQEIGIICRVMPENFGVFVLVGHGFMLTNPFSLFVATVFKNMYYKKLSNRIYVAKNVVSAWRRIQRLNDSI